MVHRNSNGGSDGVPNDLVDLMTVEKPVIDNYRLVSESMIKKRGSNADRSPSNRNHKFSVNCISPKHQCTMAQINSYELTVDTYAKKPMSSIEGHVVHENKSFDIQIDAFRNPSAIEQET